MCVAIYKPPGEEIAKETLASCFTTNPHGAGFMYPLDGKVVVQKGYFKFEDFWEAYSAAMEGPAKGLGVAIHFRIMTSGFKDEINCHPHVVADDFAFIHNGILSEYSDAKSKLSDTALFMKDQLVPLYKTLGQDLLHQSPIFYLMEQFVKPSKMVFMTGKQDVWIMGEKLGDYIGKVWYSNLHWKREPYVAPAASNWRGGHQSYNRPEGLRSCTAYGCYLNNRWYSWAQYYETWPNDGPVDAYLAGKKLGHNSFGTLMVEEDVAQEGNLLPFDKREGTSEKKSEHSPDEKRGNSCASGTNDCNADLRAAMVSEDCGELGVSDGVVVEGVVPPLSWDGTKCKICGWELSGIEIQAEEGMCIDCMNDTFLQK